MYNLKKIETRNDRKEIDDGNELNTTSR